MNGQKRDWTLVLLTGCAGLIAALIAISVSIPLGHYAATRNSLLSFSQFYFFPGGMFGAIVSGCFALQRYLGSLRTFVVITIASMTAYFVSVCVAVAVESYSPFLPSQERGDVSGQALFLGGLAGAFCIICTVSLLFNSGLTWQRRIIKALCWTPVGAILAVIGWALGPSLGVALNLAAPADTFKNHLFSLWAVWQAGIGFVLGLVVEGQRRQRMTNLRGTNPGK